MTLVLTGGSHPGFPLVHVGGSESGADQSANDTIADTKNAVVIIKRVRSRK